ncbi:hypothetical protein PM03_06760 [Thalassobacter stenotrophicus]|nr:hypothetical protein [Thalassobacter stenotrophicus]KGK79213.1 hypothetical protein PM03_06760 [Thalassobacter stenotrophicus]KGL00577.1 hypothetical protein PM04_14430 [Thalassobacter sp. 16PALIMAR09]
MGVFRKTLTILAVLFVSACASEDPLIYQQPDMGSFQMKWNIVVADNARLVPPSRSATPAEWQDVLGAEIDRRFSGYAGGRDFHIAVNVDGYALAPPGIPVLLAPKSILVLSANVWDDAEARKLHAEPERITVFEGANATTIIGSGFTKTKEEQMRALSRNAARAIQNWILTKPEWLALPPLLAAQTSEAEAQLE